MVDSSYGYHNSSNSDVLNSPCYESDYRSSYPEPILYLSDKEKSAKKNKHKKNFNSIIIRTEKKPNLYKQINNKNFFTGEKRSKF